MKNIAKRGKQHAEDAVRRQWALLRHLPRSPRKIEARKLWQLLRAEGFLEDERTIQRDLQKLSALFPLQCDERSKPYGWSWTKDAPVLSLPTLTPSEALAFRLVKQFVEPLLPVSIMASLSGHFEAADQVLRTFTGVARSWPNKVRIVHPTQVLQTPKIPRKVYTDITDALLRDQMLGVTYGRCGKEKRLELHPLALVQRGAVTYLVARAFDFDDARLYALHRFRRTEVLDRSAKSGFDIDAYLAGGALEFGDGRRIRLEALLDRSAAQHLRESPLSEDQTLADQPDGRVLLKAGVADSRQLRWWLLGFGAAAEVLKPESLRSDFRSIASALARAYR